MTQRIDYMSQPSPLFKKFLDFSLALQEGAIGEELRELVSLRVSQINGCAFCVDMHVKKMKIQGERELRMHHVAIWRESPLFSARERAALAWAEALTVLAPGGVSDAQYAEARAHFSEQELTDLTYGLMAINGWNLINVAFATPPGIRDKAYGLSKANLE